MHCIVNVNICIKGPDDKTIVFCLQVLANTHIAMLKNYAELCKRKKERNIFKIETIMHLFYLSIARLD